MSYSSESLRMLILLKLLLINTKAHFLFIVPQDFQIIQDEHIELNEEVQDGMDQFSNNNEESVDSYFKSQPITNEGTFKQKKDEIPRLLFGINLPQISGKERFIFKLLLIISNLLLFERKFIILLI